METRTYSRDKIRRESKERMQKRKDPQSPSKLTKVQAVSSPNVSSSFTVSFVQDLTQPWNVGFLAPFDLVLSQISIHCPFNRVWVQPVLSSGGSVSEFPLEEGYTRMEQSITMKEGEWIRLEPGTRMVIDRNGFLFITLIGERSRG